MNIQLPKHINSKSKTYVYIDAANMFYSQKTMGFMIDYKKLYETLNDFFNIQSITYYTGYDPDNSKQLKFLAKLGEFGYKIISKPIKHIKTKNNKVDKANVDVELAIDAVLEMASYKNIIIASGDSDFEYLLKILKKQKRNILILSARGHVSRELRQLSDKYIPLESMRKEIGV